MAETEVITPEQATDTQVVEKNPFDENSWQSGAPAPAPEQTPAAPTPEGDGGTAAPAPDTEMLDSNEWLKREFGWETPDAAKKELEELRKLRETAQTPAEHKFANDVSRQYYDAITNGKTDDLYNILHQQKQLERLEKLELTSAKEATDIIKANLQFRHKDLSQPEIERIFNRQYKLPAQPKQGVDQDDAEYALQLEQWKEQVSEIEQDMIIDAKLALPELSKFKSELTLPDIPKVEPDQSKSDQEVLAAQEAFRTNFSQHLERDYTKFDGFNVTAKDEEVELPINYVITPDELSQSKQLLQDFNVNEFLDKRWFDDKGNPQITQMQKDLYLLNNAEKVLQKVANEAATKRLEHYLKTKANIKVDGQPQGTFTPDNKTEKDKEEATIWNA